MTPAEIKMLRLELGRSQRSFALLCGVSPQTILNWEQGKTPLRGAALRLLQVLRASVALLSMLGLVSKKGKT